MRTQELLVTNCPEPRTLCLSLSWFFSSPHFIDEETEAQGLRSFLRSQSFQTPGLKSESVCPSTHAPCSITPSLGWGAWRRLSLRVLVAGSATDQASIPACDYIPARPGTRRNCTSVDEVDPSFNQRVTEVLVSRVPRPMGLHREVLLAQELASFQIPTYKISSPTPQLRPASPQGHCLQSG